ncbi:MAG: radical SAM protein [Myxococcales bacterium]|nr:radical SAM protein [Myxococcales bacterium]
MQAPIASHQEGRATERVASHIDLKVRTLLRREPSPEGGWRWAINPYDGCAFGCTFCHLRLDRKDFAGWLSFEKRIAVKTNSVEVLRRELEAAALDRPIHLGTATEPWQPAEEHFRLTRSILAALEELETVDLRIHTRSSLIARDADLIRELSRKGDVTVTLSIGSLDDRVNRLLEPLAPSAFRRLAALEALSRAGVKVGLMVSPVMPGLEEEELGLEPLLVRASNAGARFAGVSMLQLGPGQRETFLAHVTTAYPELAARFRRVLGRRPPTEEEKAELHSSFHRLCERVGLLPAAESPAPKSPRRDTPSQLALFDASLT